MRRITRKRLATITGICVWTCASIVAAVGYYNAHQSGKEQRERIANLEDRDEAIAALFVSNNHGLAITDYEGRVLEWNPFLENLTGVKKEEMLGKTLEGMMDATAWKKHGEGYARFISREGAENLTININCDMGPPGKLVPVNIIARVVKPRRGGQKYAIALVNYQNKTVMVNGDKNHEPVHTPTASSAD